MALPSDFNLDFRVNLALLDREIRQSNIAFQARRRAAARDFPHAPVIMKDRVVRTGNPPIQHLKPNQAAFDALIMLLHQGVPSDEIPLIEGDCPTQSCLQRRGRLINVVAIQAVFHF